ncbi:monooxygenase [Rhodofomes roseus]|uniref:Monooxygenase n=1 Tax=Rhodofomes roseus TaxID=34475 RepID=A0ABQ8KA35_9APHY|nr:monooxygenase [Rhodofomes roseus]KAH9834127.1 monooxygenase [Rhodofomes roseus]
MSPAPEPFDVPVLIVGAGPVGLVLALTLIKNGIKVRIVEKEAGTHKGQRGTGIMPRSLELYQYLGLLPEILKRGRPLLPSLVYKLPGGTDIMKEFYLAEPKETTPSTPIINIRSLGQDRLEKLLHERLEKLGCRVEFKTTMTSFSQFDDHVEVQLVKSGIDQDVTETVQCKWMVGADGAKGIIRKQLGLEFSGETRGVEERFVSGDLEVKNLSDEHWHVWGDPSTILVSLRGTETPGIFHLIMGGQIEFDKVVSDREELAKAVKAGTHRDDLEIGEPTWLYETTPNIRMTEKFSQGRVFLAGDACHVHPFFGAQGSNSGVQDAFNLAWKLVLVEKGLAAPTLLASYTAERVPVIAEVLRRTTNIHDKTQVMGNDGRGLDAWDRGGSLKMLGINYRWSSIVLDERNPYMAEAPQDPYGVEAGDMVRAGDRAPDAPGLVPIEGGETSLFKIFGPTCHTVLLFAGNDSAEEVRRVLTKLKGYPEDAVRSVVIYPRGALPEVIDDADLVVFDSEQHAYVGYCCSDDDLTIAIVRPDGIVGGIVFGAPGLRRYFRAVFSTLSV